MKRYIKWEHERGTWEYDIFCLLIIVFIFATPKDWFSNYKPPANQTPAQVVKPEETS